MRLKAYPEFQRQFCPFCRENRKLPYCKEEVRCADCPWKGKEPEVAYPGDLTMKVCACCGKNIYIPEEITGYIYRRQHNAAVENTIIDYYCGWNCMRKTEREVERIYKKIGVPTPSFRVREDV